MNANSPVTVTKLERRPDGSIGPTATSVPETISELELHIINTKVLRKTSERAKEIFLLEWEGDKVPCGAVINGRSIDWTQHGMVMSDHGEDMGVYERIVEFGGASRKEQKMLVFAD